MVRRRRSEVTSAAEEDGPEEAPEEPQKKELAGNPFGGSGEMTFPEPREMERGFETITRSVYDDELDIQKEYAACEAALRVRDALSPMALERAVVF